MRTMLWMLVLVLVGCGNSAGSMDVEPYDSPFDGETTVSSLTDEQRISFCEGWQSHVENAIGQSTIDALAEKQQALNNSTVTPEECRAAVLAYQAFRPYRLFTGSCEDIARRAARCSSATIDQVEQAASYITTYYIELEQHLSCDLAGKSNPLAPFEERWNGRIPPDIMAAFECVFVDP